MDGNKDEALRALKIAQDAYAINDLAKANKFLDKSVRLFPLPSQQQALSSAISVAGKASHKTAASSSPKTNESSSFSSSSRAYASHSRSSPNGKKPNTFTSSQKKNEETDDAPQRSCTPEQKAQVQSIINAKTLYDVLGISQSADDSQIKKAYKKLALKLHPDKNPAPGAEKAFKRLSHAFQMLSDPQKRAVYDQTGEESEAEARINQQRARAASAARSRGQDGSGVYYADEISPEELFEMFFGGGGLRRRATPFQSYTYTYGGNKFTPQAQARTRAQTARQQAEQETSWPQVIRNLLPLAVFLLISLWMSSADMGSTQEYSFQRTNTFSVEKSTSRANVQYFITPNLVQKYRASQNSQKLWKNLEMVIERDKLTNLMDLCNRQKQYLSKLKQAQHSYFTNQELRDRYAKEVENYAMEHCQEYNHLSRALRA